MTEPLHELITEIAAAPRSVGALTLYALVSTLEHEPAGCLFKLSKLRDLSVDQRQLAYRLIELMAQGGNRGEAWRHAKQQMDDLIRAT